MKVLFAAMHRKDRSPSQRFRFEQYLDFLAENDVESHLSPLIDALEDKVLYATGAYLAKFRILLSSIQKRRKDLARLSEFDAVFIQREAFMTGSTYFEQRFSKSGLPVVFDFDDSIWLADQSKANRRLSWLKNPEKTNDIIAISSVVVAGNEYLADHARKYNPKVEIIPTTIDTEVYKRIGAKNSLGGRPATVNIGWSGSFSTVKHFESALPALREIADRYKGDVAFDLIGDPAYHCANPEIKGKPWCLTTEIEDLSRFDIGIMPLPDNDWSRGKCGLKALQYMALEIPCIASPVGVNMEIVQDGINGFLASTKEEWVEKLTALIEDPDLRKRIGQAGRRTVIEKYSVEANKQKYLGLFQKI